MANTILKFTTILSLLIPLALIQSQLVSSIDFDDDIEIEDDEEYVLDTPLVQPHLGPTRSRFLASMVIKKGARCDVVTNNICNGVPANKGKSFLFCCKNHCRNVLTDRNHCGVCGRKCKGFGLRCCNGVCTNVLSNDNHCGKCNKKCSPGDPCGNGFCGYA